MIRVSIAIQHHPVRADLAAELLHDLGDPDAVLATDPDPPPPGTPSSSPLWNPWRCYRHALHTTPAWATHRLILQDDVIVCPGFAAAATAALTARPDRVVTFYVGGNAKLAAPRVHYAAQHGRSWAELRHFNWCPAVALAWPAALAADCLAYVDRHRGLNGHRSDDEIIGRFLRAAGQIPLATVPSLVDHPDDVPSLIGDKARGGKDRNRIAACWIGDCPADRIDWS